MARSRYGSSSGSDLGIAAVSSGGLRAFIARESGWALRWEGGSAEPQGLPYEPRGTAAAASFIGDTDLLLSGHEDGTVRLWDFGKGASEKPALFLGHQKPITSVCASADGTMIAASATDGKVIVWDAKTQKVLRGWKMPGAVHGIAFDDKSQHLATANRNGAVYILRLKSKDSGQ
jgi:WD40 repeat protein